MPFALSSLISRAQQMRHPSREQMMDFFHHSYDVLETPLTLCEGLEIIASNPAAAHLFSCAGLCEAGGSPDSLLLSTIISDQKQIEDLFQGPRRQAQTSLNERSLAVTARPWSYNRHLWLMHWHDQTYIDSLQHRLSETRSHDQTTGTLVPAAFFQQAALAMAMMEHAIMARLEIRERPLSRLPLNDERLGETLLNLAERLRRELDEASLLGRPNSASLTLLIPTEGGADEHKHILRQINRIAREVAAPHHVHLGAACYPQSARTLASLYNCTDLALQASTRNSEPRLFSKEMAQQAERLEQLARDMPAAIEKNEITPYFQPIIHSRSGRIKGFEALIRWFHPTLGFVTPPDIIAIAQENELLHRVTAHVLNEAVTQMKQWPSPIQFAVNVTPTQLNSELVDLVRDTVRAAQIDPGRLEIEVTEDALIADFFESAKILARLRAIGVSVAMDDFGAGYTSMRNLRTLNFSKIKIDKSISDGLPDDKKSISIVKSLMYMARELGVDITIEGIEEERQLELLRRFDCGIQGYVFAKPMAAKDLGDMRKFILPQLEESSVTSDIREKRAPLNKKVADKAKRAEARAG